MLNRISKVWIKTGSDSACMTQSPQSQARSLGRILKSSPHFLLMGPQQSPVTSAPYPPTADFIFVPGQETSNAVSYFLISLHFFYFSSARVIKILPSSSTDSISKTFVSVLGKPEIEIFWQSILNEIDKRETNIMQNFTCLVKSTKWRTVLVRFCCCDSYQVSAIDIDFWF